jgi:hypothetical protein
VLLLAGFRTLIDQLHGELARRGHPHLRPAHGFTMQAIGLEGATASELGRRLGVSKQARARPSIAWRNWATPNAPPTRRTAGASLSA